MENFAAAESLRLSNPTVRWNFQLLYFSLIAPKIHSIFCKVIKCSNFPLRILTYLLKSFVRSRSNPPL